MYINRKLSVPDILLVAEIEAIYYAVDVVSFRNCGGMVWSYRHCEAVQQIA